MAGFVRQIASWVQLMEVCRAEGRGLRGVVSGGHRRVIRRWARHLDPRKHQGRPSGYILLCWLEQTHGIGPLPKIDYPH